MIEFSTQSSDGTSLFGQHWPAPSAKAVMALIHGFGEHCGRYAPMAKHLNTQDIAVVALDMRGHGKSQGKRGVVKSYEDLREDLTALLLQAKALYPNAPLTLYGHSMGGGLVLNYGLKTEDQIPIIASAPLISLPEPIPRPLRVMTKILAKISPKGTLPQPITGQKISNLPEEQALYESDPLNHGRLGFRLALAIVENGESLSENAEHWDRPLLLLHSKQDQLTAYEGSAEFAKRAKQVEFHPFKSCQHEMHNDTTRADVYQLMTDFILKQTK